MFLRVTSSRSDPSPGTWRRVSPRVHPCTRISLTTSCPRSRILRPSIHPIHPSVHPFTHPSRYPSISQSRDHQRRAVPGPIESTSSQTKVARRGCSIVSVEVGCVSSRPRARSILEFIRRIHEGRLLLGGLVLLSARTTPSRSRRYARDVEFIVIYFAIVLWKCRDTLGCHSLMNEGIERLLRSPCAFVSSSSSSSS